MKIAAAGGLRFIGRRCSTLKPKTDVKKKKEIIKEGDNIKLLISLILFTEKTDYLIKFNGDKVLLLLLLL